MRGRTFVLLALAAGFAAGASVASASPPRPAELRVAGGTDAWHASRFFRLEWSEPGPGEPPLVRAHYRVRDPFGATLEDSVSSHVGDGLGALPVPQIPGAYSAEVWFEDSAGENGPAATVPLRFDDVQPGASEPAAAPAWIGRTAFPLRIRLGHPAGPLPLSGIRGYAATVDPDQHGVPCAATDRCSDEETTLRRGIDGDELAISLLPEGTAYLHVVAVSGAGIKSGEVGEAVLRVDTTDPVTRLSGAPRGWTNQSVQLTAQASDGRSGMARVGDGPRPFTAIQIDDGAPTVTPGPVATADVIAEGAHRVAYYARDAAGNVNDGASGNGIADDAPFTAWVGIDRTPPAVAFANSQDPGDPDLIRVRVVDPLSGADHSRGRIGLRRAGSGDPFESLPSVPTGDGELRARWDSDAHSVGEYEFEAVGCDKAGNCAVATQRENGGSMILANPLKATTALHSAFGRHDSSRVVPYGRSVSLRGRLTSGLSTPLDDAPVRVVERFAAGAHPATHASIVRTEPDGTFSIRTPPGPSRTIELAYEGSPILARSAGQTLSLRVRSHIGLHASSGRARVGGRPVVFSGTVAAAAGAMPPEGLPVQLQFRLGRSRWMAFRTIPTDRHGRFRYAYSFSDDDSRGVRFQFRAYVSAHEDWPYEPGGSRPVVVRGY